MNDIRDIAAHFVRARTAKAGFADFPGALPDDLDDCYAVQRAEIDLWPDRLAGWKVGRLSADIAVRVGTDRFLGPIFAETVDETPGAIRCFPAFRDGFAAFEAEILIRLAEDADPARQDWTTEDAASLIGPMHIGVEVAGSPLSTINSLGSRASVCGFGNNAGLIVGPEIADWRARAQEPLSCAVSVNGTEIARKSRPALAAGAVEALVVTLRQAARMGLPLRAGQWVSTGALTGVHPVRIGDRCVGDFGAFGSVACAVEEIV